MFRLCEFTLLPLENFDPFAGSYAKCINKHSQSFFEEIKRLNEFQKSKNYLKVHFFLLVLGATYIPVAGSVRNLSSTYPQALVFGGAVSINCTWLKKEGCFSNVYLFSSTWKHAKSNIKYSSFAKYILVICQGRTNS
jgi:hypothetical protein